jgi:hypothetical protein
MRSFPATESEAALLHWKRHYPCAYLMAKTSRTKFVIVRPHCPGSKLVTQCLYSSPMTDGVPEDQTVMMCPAAPRKVMSV